MIVWELSLIIVIFIINYYLLLSVRQFRNLNWWIFLCLFFEALLEGLFPCEKFVWKIIIIIIIILSRKVFRYGKISLECWNVGNFYPIFRLA